MCRWSASTITVFAKPDAESPDAAPASPRGRDHGVPENAMSRGEHAQRGRMPGGRRAARGRNPCAGGLDGQRVGARAGAAGGLAASPRQRRCAAAATGRARGRRWASRAGPWASAPRRAAASPRGGRRAHDDVEVQRPIDRAAGHSGAEPLHRAHATPSRVCLSNLPTRRGSRTRPPRVPGRRGQRGRSAAAPATSAAR